MMSAVASCSGIQVQLPVAELNKAKWDSLGVKWIESLAGNPFLAWAELPCGWNVREQAADDFDKWSFTVLDSDGTPKADVWMKTAPWEKKAIVTMISNAAATARKAAPKAGQKEFDSILSGYNIAVRTTNGMGSRGQLYIDEEYAKLEAFVESHPEFRSNLPMYGKHHCYDDGTGGTMTALMAMECALRNP